MEESIEDMITRLNITLVTPPIDDKDLASATYFVIRHGYSVYNFQD